MADQDEDLPPNPLPHQLEGNQLVVSPLPASSLAIYFAASRQSCTETGVACCDFAAVPHFDTVRGRRQTPRASARDPTARVNSPCCSATALPQHSLHSCMSSVLTLLRSLPCFRSPTARLLPRPRTPRRRRRRLRGARRERRGYTRPSVERQAPPLAFQRSRQRQREARAPALSLPFHLHLRLRLPSCTASPHPPPPSHYTPPPSLAREASVHPLPLLALLGAAPPISSEARAISGPNSRRRRRREGDSRLHARVDRRPSQWG